MDDDSPKYHDVSTYLEWKSAGRPYKEHGREYFINGFLIMMAIEIILWFFGQYLLMFLVFSLVFLAFAFASVPPRHFTYRVTSEGVQIEKDFFIWDELYDFYFYKHHGKETLYITTRAFFPGALILTLGDLSPEEVK